MTRSKTRVLLSLPATLVVAAVVAAQPPRPLDLEYRETAGRLIGAAMVDTAGYDKLAYLTTRIGHRLSGSSGLERAVTWVAEQMKADGLDNVRTQPVKVPHWVRGRESAQVVAPSSEPIGMLGLGGSIATPPDGITAPVVVVGTFAELEELGADKVKGKIVLYDMRWEGYGAVRDVPRCRRLTGSPVRGGRRPRALGDGAEPLHPAHRRPELRRRRPRRFRPPPSPSRTPPGSGR